MPTIGSVINNGQGQVVAKVPGGAPGTESYVVRKLDQPTETAGPSQLSDAEKRVIAELQQRDREVRNEEQRHAATAGQFAGVPQYTYKRGPDGKLYAVEGKVPINVNVSGTQEDQEKALRRVQAAAVSVQSPSSGDTTAVAGAAAALVAQGNGPQTSEAERRQQAAKAYSQAAEIFGAIANQQI